MQPEPMKYGFVQTRPESSEPTGSSNRDESRRQMGAQRDLLHDYFQKYGSKDRLPTVNSILSRGPSQNLFPSAASSQKLIMPEPKPKQMVICPSLEQRLHQPKSAPPKQADLVEVNVKLDHLLADKKPIAPADKPPKLKKANSKAREALLKQKSRKEIMPGEKLTYEKIKSFDEAERLRKQ